MSNSKNDYAAGVNVTVQMDKILKAYPNHAAPRRARSQLVQVFQLLRARGISNPGEYLGQAIERFKQSPEADYPPLASTFFEKRLYEDY